MAVLYTPQHVYNMYKWAPHTHTHTETALYFGGVSDVFVCERVCVDVIFYSRVFSQPKRLSHSYRHTHTHTSAIQSRTRPTDERCGVRHCRRRRRRRWISNWLALCSHPTCAYIYYATLGVQQFTYTRTRERLLRAKCARAPQHPCTRANRTDVPRLRASAHRVFTVLVGPAGMR